MTVSHKLPTTPQIDRDAISAYIELVFGYLEGLVPIRIYSETGTAQKKAITEFPAPDAAAERIGALAPAAARNQSGLYVVPGTVLSPGTARAEDIVATGVVVIDLDAGDIAAKREHLAHYIGAPSFSVASGGQTPDGQDKLHLYWRLTEAATGEDLRTVAKLRAEIARKAGGDPAFGSMHQPIRVAGTVHGKNGHQAPARLLEQTGDEYDLQDLAEAIAAMPVMEEPRAHPLSHTTNMGRVGAHDLATRTIREAGIDGVTRFEALSTVIGHWIRNVRYGRCTLAEAWAAVQGHNTAMIVPPWPEDRLRRDFEALLKRDIATNGLMPRADTNDDVATPPELSDDAIADALVAAHGAKWRYTAAWGHWYLWDGRRWSRDEIGRIREQARLSARAAAFGLERASEARRLTSHKTISATVAIASCDPRLATRSTDWDAWPMLLNTPAGMIDLRSGEVRDHDPMFLMTQMTRASPGSGCPRWLAFLDHVTGGDSELQAYLQRLSGYILTGDISEQVFVFVHGQGANGKSVFLSTLSAILGDYAATATQTAFMASSHERHLTELAGLRAARLVTVPETERGRAWAEARIKAVTGGEKIRANFMRQDHFEFTPQFKLIVAGNHRPEIGDVGEAMRRRLHLVPFDVTVPPEQRDRDLSRKLLAEADGILGWMIEGCAQWQCSGLVPPARVRDAAAAYLADEDLTGQWVDQYCTTGQTCRQSARDLFASWSAFAREAGVEPGSQKALGEALRQRGFVAAKIAGSRGWQGISLRHSGQAATA